MGEVRPAERGSPCSSVAQKVAFRYRAERWDMHSMVGSPREAEGGAQGTKRTRSHTSKSAVGTGDSLARALVDSGTEEVAPPNKGKDPSPQGEEERWRWAAHLQLQRDRD